MRKPVDESTWQRRKLLQSIGIWAATIVALGSVMFTLGFFVGRASGGTELEVYVQNPEGVYLRAETETATAVSSGQDMLITTTVTPAVMTSTVQSTASQTSAETTQTTTDTSITVETTTQTATQTATVSTSATVAHVSGKININTATEAQLDTLPGIGPAKAKSIIAYREANGAFKSIEDLVLVKGIGDKTMADLRPLITIGE